MPSQETNHDINLEAELPEDINEIAVKQGEDPNITLALIEELRNMIFEKGEITPQRNDDKFLIKFLRARYWKVDLAYKLIVSYCQFRENNKDLYEKVRPLDLRRIADEDIVQIGPDRDQANRRAIIYRFGSWKPSKLPVDEIFKATLVLIEIGSMEPIAQVMGAVGIFDLKGLGLSHIMQLTPSVAQKMLSLMVTSMPLRTDAIHIVNQNWAFSAAFNIFKPFLSARMKERIFIHGSDMTSLHKFISPAHLPKRYGGTQEDYPYQNWVENLSKNQSVIRDLEHLGYVIDSKDKVGL